MDGALDAYRFAVVAYRQADDAAAREAAARRELERVLSAPPPTGPADEVHALRQRVRVLEEVYCPYSRMHTLPL